MIIGNGDIASVLQDKDGFCFFASGVSNSQEIRVDQYEREVLLLANQNRNQHLVYFSSLAIFYSDTRYTRHKRHMENLVKRFFSSYTIIRLGNITWGNNPNTIINNLKAKIKNAEPFEVKDEYRYLVDQEEFLHWVSLIPSWNCELNITGRRVKVADIVKEIKEGKL